MPSTFTYIFLMTCLPGAGCLMPLLIQSSNPPSSLAYISQNYAAMEHFFVPNSYFFSRIRTFVGILPPKAARRHTCRFHIERVVRLVINSITWWLMVVSN